VLGPGAPARRMLEDVMVASERAAGLTRQLLAYAGKERLTTESIDLSALVKELTGLLTASIPKSVHLVFDLQDGLPCVNAARTQLQQMIMNLVINGTEAIPRNITGTAKIPTAARTLKEEEHSLAIIPIPKTDQPYVALMVSDTGQGISPEIQTRIFDPFFTTKFAGRGLGLSAVLGILKGHGGTITLNSTPNAGTTFTLMLPAKSA